MKKRENRVYAVLAAVTALAFILPGLSAPRGRSTADFFRSFDQDLGLRSAAKKRDPAAPSSPESAGKDFYQRTFSWTGADRQSKQVTFSLAKSRVRSEMNDFGVPRGMEHSLLLQKKGFSRIGISKGTEIYMVNYREIFRRNLDYFKELARDLEAAVTPLLAENALIEFLFFVQSIKYEKPPFYYHNKFINSFFPPLICLYEQFGDCDSKSVLLAVFLANHNEKEKTALLFVNRQGLKHSILLVKRLPSPGMSALFIKGEGYYIPLEASTPGWAPGFVNPRIWDAITSGNFRFTALQ